MTFAIVLADTTTTIAWVILLVSVLGWIVYGLSNIRSASREELRATFAALRSRLRVSRDSEPTPLISERREAVSTTPRPRRASTAIAIVMIEVEFI